MSASIDFYYHPLSPPSRCVWMVLEELGLKYNEKIVDVFKGEQKAEAFKKVNVRQKIPAIRDGDVSIGESRAIAAYIVSEYGSRCKNQSLYPSSPRKRAVVDQHLYIGENIWEQIFSYVNLGGVFFQGGVTQTDKINTVKEALQMIETLLTEHTFTASDDFTIADIFYYAAVSMLDAVDFNDFCAFPKIVAWRKWISERPWHKKTWGEPAAKLRTAYQDKVKENSGKQ